MADAAIDAGTTTSNEHQALFDAQARFFAEGHTLPRRFREEQLRAFLAAIEAHRGEIDDALYADLRKNPTEAYVTETSMLTSEIKHALAGLKRWMKPTRSLAPVALQPAMSEVHRQPLGSNLILGAWNYPVQLSIQPVVAAIAAGNTAVVKPSELSPNASAVIAKIVRSAFPPEFVACVEGGIEASQALLQLPWDHIFFTGGTRVGRIVAHAAAEHLSRCTLELGGKSPAIVGKSANLHTAASRIAWGKFTNAGQTCVAPDYLLVDDAVYDRFVPILKARLAEMYGADPKQSPDYGRIVNERHHARLVALIDEAKVVHGGQTDADDRYIAPTLLGEVTVDDAIMQDEIFGPILPMIRVGSLDEAMTTIKRHPNPLALYIFTEDKAEADTVIQRVSFGGGCVNNAVYHLGDPALPFGGIRTSGAGAYHGHHGFRTFSHDKAILRSNATHALDLDVKYPPYAGKLKQLKLLLG